MANYEIPWVPPDISGGAAMLIGVLNSNRQHEIAQEQADTQRRYAENTLARESAREARDKHAFDQGEKDRRVKAITSANELRRQGRHGEASMLLKLAGVEAAPVVGPATTTPPEIVTPQMAAASLQETPPGPAPEAAMTHFASPMAAAANAVPRSEVGTGMTVPEVPQEFAPPPPAPGTPPPPTAAEDTLPLTIPGDNVPGKPTGAYRYTGPGGEDLGTFDPAEEEAFRQQRAGRVTEALGPMGEKVQKVAELLATGDIDQKQAGAILTMLRNEESLSSKDADREDKQAHEALMNKLYKNEPLTVQDRKDLAAIMGGSKVSAARAGNPYKQESVNDRIFSLLERRTAAIRNSGSYQKLIANDKTVRGVAANLATNLPLAHRDAQVSLARIFRQAQPTESEMHLLYDQLGGWSDKFEQFKAKVRNGDLSPEQMRQLRASARVVAHEHQTDVENFMNSARSGLGPKSGIDLAPDQAQAEFDMLGANLGFKPGELPPLYETEGGITLGSKQGPSVRPRSAKTNPEDALIEGVK